MDAKVKANGKRKREKRNWEQGATNAKESKLRKKQKSKTGTTRRKKSRKNEVDKVT